MEAKKYRKQPVVIEAIHYDGTAESLEAISAFTGRDLKLSVFEDGLTIETLEGPLHATPGDYIIKGVKGEFYPCKPDIFLATYSDVSAAALFERRTGLSFEEALVFAKRGARIRRAGWNGKGMYVGFVPARNGLPATLETAEFLGVDHQAGIRVNGYMRMRAADGSLVVGWLASQTDMTASDWELVD